MGRVRAVALAALAGVALAFAVLGPAGCGVDRLAAAAQAAPTRLETVLREMDAASAKFQSAQADLRQQIFTKVVNDTDEQKGMVYFLRKGGATQMGIKMLPQPAQIVEFKDGALRVFNPGTNHVDEFASSGKNQALTETLMTLGFGGGGADLKRSWTIEDQGAEEMSDGAKTVPVEKLDLVSKDENVRKNFTHVTIWVDPVRAVTLKQVFLLASNGRATGDTRTVFYTNIRMNQPVDVGPFAIKCKGKCG